MSFRRIILKVFKPTKAVTQWVPFYRCRNTVTLAGLFSWLSKHVTLEGSFLWLSKHVTLAGSFLWLSKHVTLAGSFLWLSNHRDPGGFIFQAEKAVTQWVPFSAYLHFITFDKS